MLQAGLKSPLFSIIVCTHNRAQSLKETLLQAAAVTREEGLDCELIVCPNGCTDDTALVIDDCFRRNADLNWLLCNRATPGKSAALVDGILASHGDYILILDDDNKLLKGWMSDALAVLTKDSSVGVVGCASELPDSVIVPDELRPFLRHYAVGAQHPTPPWGVWGAGLVFRGEPFRMLLNNGYRFLLGGRVGNNLIAGEDTELCLIYERLGLKTVSTPFLGIIHQIEQHRFTLAYFLKLAQSEGAAFQWYRNYRRENAVVHSGSLKTAQATLKELAKASLSCCLNKLLFVLSGKIRLGMKYRSALGRLKAIPDVIRARERLLSSVQRLNPTEALAESPDPVECK
jgi:glycosyltransferase involved in cell wall biosynthesis